MSSAAASFPLFPLNTTLVPGLVMPLHIFEPRYRELVETLLAVVDEDAREFGIIAVRDGHDVDRQGIAALYPIGTAALLRKATRLPDGRYDIVTTGTRRFRINSIDTRQPLIRGDVEFLAEDDDAGQAAEVAELAALVARRFTAYRLALSGQLVDEQVAPVDAELPDDPAILSYLVTAAMVLPGAERQRLLAAPSTTARLDDEATLLRREAGLIAALRAVPAIDVASTASTGFSAN